jgi:L-threonylcarbamoyladenylate synthase
LSDADLHAAVEVLKNAGVVLHATEGVWGFCCDPRQSAAREKILRIKGREAQKGFIVIAGDASVFEDQLCSVTPSHRAEILASWPGAHTWVLPDNNYAPDVRGFRDTVACRVPGHAQARLICRLFGGALISTSANRSGQPAFVDAERAAAAFEQSVDFVLAGEVDRAGVPSTIHGLDGRIIR